MNGEKSLLVNNLVSQKIVRITNHPKINVNLAANYLFTIKEGIKHEKIVDKFQDLLISIMSELEVKDSTSKNRNMNIRYNFL